MGSACLKQAFGAYVRKQGQRLWQLNYYRMKLNAYNRVAFRDAHKGSTMHFTHSWLEFMPFQVQWDSVSCLSHLHTTAESRAQEGTLRPLLRFSLQTSLQSHPPHTHTPNGTMFSYSLQHTSHVEFPRRLILKHRWETMHFIKCKHLCLEGVGKQPIHGLK